MQCALGKRRIALGLRRLLLRPRQPKLRSCSSAATRVSREKGSTEALARGLTGRKMVFHQNHGIFSVGETVAEAAWWFISTERNCQAQLLAEAAGTPTLVDHANARFTAEQTGTPYAGWFSYQPLWDEVVRTDPDLFD